MAALYVKIHCSTKKLKRFCVASPMPLLALVTLIINTYGPYLQNINPLISVVFINISAQQSVDDINCLRCCPSTGLSACDEGGDEY